MKLSEVILKYSCAAYPPIGITMGKLYHIGKDTKGVYFTDGKYTEYAELWYIKMLFTPSNAEWKEIEALLK